MFGFKEPILNTSCFIDFNMYNINLLFNCMCNAGENWASSPYSPFAKPVTYGLSDPWRKL